MLYGNKGITRRRFLGKASHGIVATAAAGVFPTALIGCSSPREFDVLIKGGTVYDGVNTKPLVADIGITGHKITAIGDLPGKARTVLDASRLIVTPGFIDIHTHCDLSFLLSGSKRHLARVMPSWKGNYCYLYQGVTTVVTGNCGYGYTDIDELYDLVSSLEFGTNVYHLAPHGAIREELFGDNQPMELSASQLDRIRGRVAEEMDKGAVGLSAGLEYAPGLLASTDELTEICKVVARKGGVYTVHLRDQTGRVGPDGKPGVITAIEETIEISRRAEITAEISHIKIKPPFGETKAEHLLELIEDARNEGINVTADQYPYAAGSTLINILLPDDFKTSKGVKEKYKTADGRKQIEKAISEAFEHTPPEKTTVTFYPEHEEFEGKTLLEIAEMMDKAPAEAYTDMVCEETAPNGVFFTQDIDVVRALMPHDYMITASDGATVPKGMTHPHPRTYGTFPKKLRKFVLDEKLMTLHEAIRSMTSLPAEQFNMKDKGVIAVGNAADITVMNIASVTDQATYEEPHQYAEGFVHVLVSGIPSIVNGKATGDRGGKTLRRS